MAVWFTNQLARLNELNDEEAKEEVLLEVYIKLQGVGNQELEEISRNIDLSGIFSHLTSNDRSCLGELCKILQIFLKGLSPGEAHRRYPSELRRLVVHAEPAVRTVILQELVRQAGWKPTSLLEDVDLLTQTIERIGDEDLSVANLAMSAVTKIGSAEEGAKALYSGKALVSMARMLAKNDVASFRVYEVVVAIAKQSEGCMRRSIESGFLSSLINVLDNDDVLLQLNTLELMSDLAKNEAGLKYLEDQNVLKRLAERIERANEDVLSNLFVPGLMKFFASLAAQRPNEIFSKYPIVVSSLFEVIHSEDTSLLGNALDTLGHVASSVEGKYALQAIGDCMSSGLKRIGEIINQGPVEMRLRALTSLVPILRVEKNEQDNRILSLTKSWFDSLGNDPLGTIVTFCKRPVERSESLALVATISEQTWGQEYLAECPGLIEYLLDRNADTFKELKYRIVKNLAEADELRDAFDSETREKLENFVRQGPFHVDTVTEIATE